MNQPHPQLVFVAGPQQGQRVALNRPLGVLGRGPGADVLLSEEYVSRQQARYELLQAGPTLVNLSDRGTWINGKRYKRGRQVLLETGDVIGAGRDTQMLFVAAGDDADAAVAVFTESGTGGKDAFGRRVQPAGAPPAEALVPPADDIALEPVEPVEAPEPEKKKKPSEVPADERLRQDAKARRRKIAIGLGVYLGLLAVVAIALKVYLGKTAGEMPLPHVLTDREIAEHLTARLENITPNRVKMEERLDHALGLYQQYGTTSTKLSEMALAFRQALAYSGQTFFTDARADEIYTRVMQELTRVTTSTYRNAYLYERNGDWVEADREFNRVLNIVGDRDNPIFKNVQEHISRVRYFRFKKAPEKRQPYQA